MKELSERSSAEESAAAARELIEFRTVARRDRMLGRWAAGLMGLPAEAVEPYAQSVAAADLDEGGEDDVFYKVAFDLQRAGIAMSDERLRRKMELLLDVARSEIEADA
jgi:hypothetical protein